jgi:hypothetical protein
MACSMRVQQHCTALPKARHYTLRSHLASHPTYKVQSLQQSGGKEGVLWSTGSSTSIAACLHALQSVTCENRTAGHHNLPTNDQALLMLETITWPLQSNELSPTWPSVATQRTARAETAAGAHSATCKTYGKGCCVFARAFRSAILKRRAAVALCHSASAPASASASASAGLQGGHAAAGGA